MLGFRTPYGRLAGLTDEALLSAMYADMHGGTRSLKITAPGRLRLLDETIVTEINKRFPPQRTVRIHDMAASNAITSLELFERLTGRPVTVLATDYYDAIDDVQVGPWHVVFDRDGEPLQYALGSIGLATSRRRPRLMLFMLRKFLLPRARRIARNDTAVTHIPLFHPRVLELAARDGRFMIGRDDLFAPAPGEFEIIRVMNTLTEWNFPRPECEAAVVKIGQLVVDGGLLVLGRNEGDRVDATIFEKRDAGLVRQRFMPVADLGQGYALREFVVRA